MRTYHVDKVGRDTKWLPQVTIKQLSCCMKETHLTHFYLSLNLLVDIFFSTCTQETFSTYHVFLNCEVIIQMSFEFALVYNEATMQTCLLCICSSFQKYKQVILKLLYVAQGNKGYKCIIRRLNNLF
jgi:hypothetical protein